MKKMFIVLTSAFLVGSGLYAMEEAPAEQVDTTVPMETVVLDEGTVSPEEAVIVPTKNEQAIWCAIAVSNSIWDRAEGLLTVPAIESEQIRYTTPETVYKRTANGIWVECKAQDAAVAVSEVVAQHLDVFVAELETQAAAEAQAAPAQTEAQAAPSQAVETAGRARILANAAAASAIARRLGHGARVHVESHAGTYARASVATVLFAATFSNPVTASYAVAQTAFYFGSAAIAPAAIVAGPRIVREARRAGQSVATGASHVRRVILDKFTKRK